MPDSKRAILSTIVVFLLFLMISGVLLRITAPITHNYDWHLRETLSGSIDFLIVGASHGQCSLYTRVIDQITGSNSYNLCYDSQKNIEKCYLLSKELSRNDVKTIVLELSYDTLTFSEKTNYTDANIFSIMRMDSLSDRIPYFIHYVNLDNKLYVYAAMMYSGMFELLRPHKPFNAVQADLKGSVLFSANDYSLHEEEVSDKYHNKQFTVSSFKQETINGFTDLINLGKACGARVIVAVVPVSDHYLWCTDNLDEFNEWAKQYCADQNVEFYDFNLLRDRYTLFSDSDCYSTDPHHMSEKGARIFSEVFSTIIQEAYGGKDVSGYFYSSFEEMIIDSPYSRIQET